MRTRIRRSCTFILSAPLVSLSTVAKAEVEHEFQSWSAVFAQGRVTGSDTGLGIWFDGHVRRGSTATNVLLRPGIGWFFTPRISVWAGYLLTPTFVDGGPDRYEHRPWEQVQVVLPAASATFTLRTRLEQRVVQDEPGLGWRLRQLVRWQQSLGEDLALVLWDEAFFGLNETEWGQPSGLDQNRAFLGPAWLPRESIRLEGGYLSIVLPRSDTTRLLHALSLNAFVSW